MIIPDDLLGVDLRSACAIHDWCYREWAENQQDKIEADAIYLRNLLTLVRLKRDKYTIARTIGCYIHWALVRFTGRLP